MRLTTAHWTISGAVKTGHHHLYSGSNCQDSLEFYAEQDPLEFLSGVASDGCSEGAHSEVGAQSLPNFLLAQIQRLRDCGVPLDMMPQRLFHQAINFIDMHVLMGCPSGEVKAIAEYIRNYWLATIIGFVLDATQDQGFIFYCADGEYAIDDAVFKIDQDNKPHYLAYTCVRNPSSVGVSADFIPRAFIVVPFTPSKIRRLRISSDGFSTINEVKFAVAQEREPELPWSLSGLEFGHKGEFGLKKWMNSRSDRGYFDDDCALIVVEKLS
jgi:hypothetical protein